MIKGKPFMKYVLIALLGAFTLAGCAGLDQFLPRAQQCQLLEVAKAKAAERGLTVDQYLDVNNLVACGEADK